MCFGKKSMVKKLLFLLLHINKLSIVYNTLVGGRMRTRHKVIQ
jgi:hypothetical protein